jgi:hypothetical protein
VANGGDASDKPEDASGKSPDASDKSKSDWWAPKLLTCLGLLFILGGLLAAVAAEGPGPSKVVTTSTATRSAQKTVTTPGNPTTTVTTSHPAAAAPKPAVTRVVTHTPKNATRTITKSPSQDTTVETTSGHPARGSDTLAMFGFGVGIILLFSGLFYGNLSEITFPGGGGIKLSPTTQAKVAGQVSTKVGESEAYLAQSAYLLALMKLAERAPSRGVEPAPESIALAVDEAVEAVKGEQSGDGEPPPTA